MANADPVEIRPYTPADEAALFTMLEEEGPEWGDYWSPTGREKYKVALTNSTSFLLFQGDTLCGFIRSREDDGFGVYIYDLLVRPAKRGQNLGRALMEQVCAHFPGQTVYVMSDVDPYYEKLGYTREGSILIVRPGG